MKKKNWDVIEESVPGGAPLAPGGYVVRIVNVKDNYNASDESKCYLNIVYDIAEGDEAGRFSDDWGKSHPFAHQFTRWYEGRSEGEFRFFLNCLEFSNKGKFSVAEWNKTCDEKQLIGLELGIVLQKEFKTNTKGVDTDYLEVRGVYASQDIRSGDFKVPDPVDKRKKIGGSQDDTVPVDAYDDVPFV